jgi:hypothetical protein
MRFSLIRRHGPRVIYFMNAFLFVLGSTTNILLRWQDENYSWSADPRRNISPTANADIGVFLEPLSGHALWGKCSKYSNGRDEFCKFCGKKRTVPKGNTFSASANLVSLKSEAQKCANWSEKWIYHAAYTGKFWIFDLLRSHRDKAKILAYRRLHVWHSLSYHPTVEIIRLKKRKPPAGYNVAHSATKCFYDQPQTIVCSRAYNENKNVPISFPRNECTLWGVIIRLALCKRREKRCCECVVETICW